MLQLAALVARAADPAPSDEAPKGCSSCEAWAQPSAPFRLIGDSWYVGSDGLSSVVVRTDDGLVLLDGMLPEQVAATVANLATLGLAVEDVRYVLVSHAHFDHAGGVAALQRRSGAEVVSTAAAAVALRRGGAPADDPQAGYGVEAMSFPPVTGPIRTLGDGEGLALGGTTFTLHATPGHTPGGASWSWKSCEGERCATVVYADSLNPVSADGFRYSDDPARVETFRASIARVRALDCDVLVPVHPSFGGLAKQAERARVKGSAAFLDPKACRAYADDAAKRLDRRLRDE